MSSWAPAGRRTPFLLEIILGACLVAAPFVLPYLGAAPNTVNRILVWGLFGIGFDILFGYTGLLSFGQSALYGTGGMVAAYLLTRAGFPHVITALVIGGVGSFPGAVLGGLIAGEIISITSMIEPAYAYIMLFAAMTLVLVLRPYGLLGVRGRE